MESGAGKRLGFWLRSTFPNRGRGMDCTWFMFVVEVTESIGLRRDLEWEREGEGAEDVVRMLFALHALRRMGRRDVSLWRITVDVAVGKEARIERSVAVDDSEMISRALLG